MSDFTKDKDNTLPVHEKSRPESYRDQMFGLKLEHLEGIIGYKFSSDRFQGKFLAGELRITPSQFSRKKSGKDPITDWELSKIIDIYQLGRNSIDFNFLKMDFDQFVAVLKDERIGTYGETSVTAARHFLLSEANTQKALGKTNKTPVSVSIYLHRQPSRAGGFGIAHKEESPTLTFYPSQQVFFEVSVPRSGFLYVLSDRIDVEITCLSPSQFAMDTQVPGGQVRIPAGSDVFDVVGPPSFYRLFAIYSTKDVNLDWLKYDEDKPGPITMPDTRLPELTAKLELIRANGGEFAVAAKDYRVLQ